MIKGRQQRVHVTVRDGQTGRSKTDTIYGETMDAVHKKIRTALKFKEETGKKK